MRVTSGKSRVRESRLPGSVRAEPNGRATRPAPAPLGTFTSIEALAENISQLSADSQKTADVLIEADAQRVTAMRSGTFSNASKA